MAVKDRPGVPPDDPLLAAAEHALKQWHDIPRIFESPTYRLDNNEVERINRYISLTRRRLTIGSHTGAETASLYHSLAITCHRCGINVYDYFCDIIDRCDAWPPNTPIERYRETFICKLACEEIVLYNGVDREPEMLFYGRDDVAFDLVFSN